MIAATVKSIRLNKEEMAHARKSAVGEKLVARATFVMAAEESATAFQAGFATLKTLNEQHAVLCHTFKDIVAANREHLKAVRTFFAHKKADERLFGEYTTGEEWAQARCGVGFDYICRCLNRAKERPLLKSANETRQSSVSQKRKRNPADDLEELLAALPTEAAREKVLKTLDLQRANLEAKKNAETEAALAKQAAELNSKAEWQRKREENEAERRQKLAVKIAVDTTAANALTVASELPKKTTTAYEAVALDEAMLIIQGIVFSVNKSEVKERKYFKRAVEFLKVRNAFHEPGMAA